MSAATCRCGAPIQWARVSGGAPFPLDLHGSPRGPARYRVIEFGPTWLVEPLDPAAEWSAYPDHRLSCPASSAAERQAVVNEALGGDDDAAA